MSDTNADEIGYSGAVESYWSLGWRSVLPLPPRSKVWPPSIKCPDRAARPPRPCQSGCECVHYTGYAAVEPSYADIMAWSETSHEMGLCLRVPDGVVGIDVDAYGAKTGAAALVEATRRWGPLPRGPRSSSRAGNLTSGIRLFRVPAGTTLETKINFPELGIGDIEVVQPHHRYAVVWPSIHAEGGQYRWCDEFDNPLPIPAIADLPELPQAWLDGLRIAPRPEFDGEVGFDVRMALTAGEPSIRVSERLRQAIKELQTPGASRHDTCCRHVMALARLGKSGEPGVKTALDILLKVLIAARAVDASDTAEGTRLEFFRMLTNDNLARELSRPSATDWMTMLVIEDQNDSGPEPGRVSGPEANADGSGAVIVDDSASRSPLEDIERGFWQSRESLARIYQTALSRMASPWATLGICAARGLTLVRPNVTLPPIVRGPGSLNFFVALVARSGGGKGAAAGAADLLIPGRSFIQRNLGSGEGLVKLFDRPKSDDGTAEFHEAILVNVDEVDTLVALSQRSASTTTPVLRSAFSAESLGFAYLNRANVGDVPAHSYRMTLVVSVQPKQSAGLLSGEGGGLPQRFMWFPAKDSRIDEIDRWPGSPLDLPHSSEWLYPRELVIPDVARDLIKRERAKNQRDEEDALDGHAIFCREKFAYALTVLDGRVHMSLEDWELSGIAADVSTFTRELCRDQLKDAARLDAIERGSLRGIEMEAADVEKLEEQVKRGERVLKWLLHKLDAAPEGYLTQSDLLHKISGRDRKTLTALLGSGHQLIRGELVDGAIRWYRG